MDADLQIMKGQGYSAYMTQNVHHIWHQEAHGPK